VTSPPPRGRHSGSRGWAEQNAALAEDFNAVRPAGLVSVRFVAAAIRRRAWLGCAILVAGLVITGTIYVAFPPAYQASTSILINNDPLADPNVQMQGNVELAQSAEVASGALHAIGLREPVTSFMRTYTVTSATDRVLVITTSASSTAAAVRRADALAIEFLRFRSGVLRTQLRLGVATLEGQSTAASQEAAVLADQIAKLPPSASRRALIKRLGKINSLLGALVYTADHYPVVTSTMVEGSSVLDTAAPIPPSRRHLAAIFGAAGVVASIAAALGLVIIATVTSNRLRRREDVARALGAPVRLSVGMVRAPRLPRRSRLTEDRRPDQRRIVAHLRTAVADGSTALAVVSVDNEQAIAPSVASLAVACAREGRRVVLADLSAGAPAARLLGASDPGIHDVSVAGAPLTVAIPNRGDVTPIGPIRSPLPTPQHQQASKALAAACAAADVLLSTVTLDPALGGDHLATWSEDIIVIVTAGRSVPAKIHATGEMIKLAGTRPASAILLGADKNDESLGVMRPSPSWQHPSRI
jgi:capsular polysaccharide biosynthesis protein